VTRQRPGDQPLPVVHDDQPAIHDLVAADLAGRKALGTERYGTPLQPHNGRDALRDLYEELLDAAVYIRQAIEERRNPAFLTIRTMQERLECRDAENRRLNDLVEELRKQVEVANRRLERAQRPTT
jgi:hypothetical protein